MVPSVPRISICVEASDRSGANSSVIDQGSAMSSIVAVASPSSDAMARRTRRRWRSSKSVSHCALQARASVADMGSICWRTVPPNRICWEAWRSRAERMRAWVEGSIGMTTYPWYQQLAMGREVQRSLQVCPWCHDDRMKIRRGSICAVLLLIACAGGETPALRQPVPLSSPAAPVKPSEPPPVSVSTASFDSTDAAPEPVDPFANTAFPPPNFDPPHERSAREGDGRWVRMGDFGARCGDPGAGD